jgi:fumarate reductase flavoprotein subunit
MLSADLAREGATGNVISAASWGDVAAWIGVAPARLEATVAEYNAACDAQYDPVFNKDRRYLIPLREPPFHGVKFFQDLHNATGTLRVNETMQVLDRCRAPIPGLYAGGDLCGGWLGWDYPIELGGIDLAFAFACGRHVGRCAV